MLYLSTKITNLPLLSIRSSGRIGTVLKPIINPHNLHIDGFFCQSVHSKNELVLLDIYIREFAPNGIIIDDHKNLSDPTDLVRLEPVIKLNFSLENKTVFSGKKKIGKVIDFAIDKDSLFVQKLYVQPPVWQSLNQNRLTIDRSSIIEVTDTKIVVSGPEEKASDKAKATSRGFAASYSANTSFINE